MTDRAVGDGRPADGRADATRRGLPRRDAKPLELRIPDASPLDLRRAEAKPDAKPPDTKHFEAGVGTGTTWSSTDKQKSIQLSPDHLEAFEPAGTNSVNDSVRATVGRSSGKRYFEIAILVRGASNYHEHGLATKGLSLEVSPSSDSNGGCGLGVSGKIQCSATTTVLVGASVGQGDVIGVAVDLDQATVYFAKNGTWLAGANPAAGTGGAKLVNGTSPVFYPVANISDGDRIRANFGLAAFTHTPPAGFQAGW